MPSSQQIQPIHPIAARFAFGADRDHPAVPGRIIGADDVLLVALVNGTWVGVTSDDPRLVEAVHRDDLCRYQRRERCRIGTVRHGYVRGAPT